MEPVLNLQMNQKQVLLKILICVFQDALIGLILYTGQGGHKEILPGGLRRPGKF